WLATLVYPLLILGVAYAFVRRGKRADPRAGTVEPGFFRAGRQMIAALARQPTMLLRVTLLSILAFGLEDLAVFSVMMAFTSTHVILTAKTSLILMGVVGSYIARFIPITPGGIGQFEWG